MKRLTAALLAAALMTPAFAYTVDQVDITATVGDGSKQAIGVIDFGVKSFAFAYQWETGAPTSETMLLALHDANIGLTLDYSPSAWGIFVNVFTYFDGTTTYVLESDGTDWPMFWVSGHGGYTEDLWDWDTGSFLGENIVPADTTGDGENWSMPTMGVSAVKLIDGGFSGWALGDAVPSTPVVPEPTTMSLLALAALGLLKRRAAR